MAFTRWFPALPCLMLLPSMALAASLAAPPHPPIQAAHTIGAMRCDGVLDEPSWAQAQPATQLYQQTPHQGEPASMKSEFRVLYDEAALYIGARLYDAHPESIQANLGRRDTSLPADRITVYLDPYHDKRSGYLFVVNAAGLRVDGLLYNDGQQDLTWDGVWEGRAHRDSLGWSAELRLPFSQFRFQSEAEPVWGIDFKRVILRRGEESLLAYTPRDGSGFVSRFPDLVGLKGMHSSGAVEIMPYATGKAAYLKHEAGDPFNDGSTLDGRMGFDLRAPVSKRLTLNATVNPDFGQVEVDPATVNLSDVESSFEEKRPYFVEGASNFKFGHEGANSSWSFNWGEPTFFYSRRIGRTPQGALPVNDYSDMPIATTILGAAKLTGKITPTTNFGTLQAITGQTHADIARLGLMYAPEVEPLTYYQVTRALKEFKERRAGLGVLSTAVVRSFDGGDLDQQLNRMSLLGGLDGWYFLDKKQVWCLNGWGAGTYVDGTTQRMIAVQRSSRHYFQRPDAGHVEVDTSATSLAGSGARLALNKQSGRLMSNTAVGFQSPGLETNDIGLQSRSDVINGHTVLGYQWTAEGKKKRYANVWAAVAATGNFDQDLTLATSVLGGNTDWKNNWGTWWQVGAQPRATDVRSTRGGPRMLSRRDAYINAGFNTDSYKKLYYNAWVYLERNEAGLNVNEGGLYAEWKPMSNLFLSAGPFVNYDHFDAQYVSTIPDAAATETYGRRYVFAQLDQTTVGADLRLNWTFTPDLSFQTYVQPFLSSAKYTGYKSLARPMTYEFDPYAYPGNANFDFGSLRGNAVLRWEYRPGSAVYLVWTQQRDDSEGLGTFDLHRGMTGVLNAPADNVFMMKVSYYLGL